MMVAEGLDDMVARLFEMAVNVWESGRHSVTLLPSRLPGPSSSFLTQAFSKLPSYATVCVTASILPKASPCRIFGYWTSWMPDPCSFSPSLSTSSSQAGDTPIQTAAIEGHVDVIKVLLEAGVDKGLKSDVSTNQV